MAGWLGAPLDAQVWERLVGVMGYMALLRNLRNLDQAGVSDEVADQVAARLADPDEVTRIFDALAEDGQITMPLGETFWSPRFGMCTDRFGTSWMVSVQGEEPQPS